LFSSNSTTPERAVQYLQYFFLLKIRPKLL
jgi:hypothetical protein